MPNKQPPKMETRLSHEDTIRFDQLVQSKGVTRTQLVREALLFYLEHHMDEAESERQRRRDEIIANALKQIENRFASLMVRIGIDLEAMYALQWTQADRKGRERLFDECHKIGVQRFKRKLEGVQLEMKNALRAQGDNLG